MPKRPFRSTSHRPCSGLYCWMQITLLFGCIFRISSD
uniref:Uncharacterized protein n=1 Tax=Arundo donax TaxID=35708 RepID=A0A0A9AW00_ARUDO